MNSNQLAYFAGLFDGEGSITISRHKPQNSKRSIQHTLRCAVSMTSEFAVREFLVFGGSICVKRASLHNPKWRDQWVWSISSNEAVNFLITMLPFLKLRNLEAKTAIEFQSARRRIYKAGIKGQPPISPQELAKRDSYWKQLKELKGRY